MSALGMRRQRLHILIGAGVAGIFRSKLSGHTGAGVGAGILLPGPETLKICSSAFLERIALRA